MRQLSTNCWLFPSRTCQNPSNPIGYKHPYMESGGCLSWIRHQLESTKLLTLFKSHCNASVRAALKGDICLSEFSIHFQSWSLSVMQLKCTIHADEYLLSKMEYPSRNIIHFIHLKREFKQIHDRLLVQLEGTFAALPEKSVENPPFLQRENPFGCVSAGKLVLKYYD